MRLLSPRHYRLGQNGFAHHLLLPVLAIIVVAGIGSYTLHAIHATAAQYYSGPCTTKTSSSAPCVNQAKDLLDGLQHAGWRSYKTATKAGSGVFAYGGQYYLNLNGTYDAATQAALKTLTSSSVGLTPGNDSSDGWQLFCTTVAKSGMQLTSNKNSGALDFKNGNKTTQTMAQIFTATCGAVTLAKSGGSTTATATKPCTNYTFSKSSTSMAASQTKPAPADCVRFIQTVLNGVYQSNYKGTYVSHADSFSAQTQTTKGLLTVDGVFGASTQSQLEAFQGAYNNLSVDGVAGSGTWSALCGEAMSFKGLSDTWKSKSYSSAVNIFSGQSKPWSGCSTSNKQATYGIHATAPTVGVPAPTPVSTPTAPTKGGGTSGGKPQALAELSALPMSIKAGKSTTLSWSISSGICTLSGDTISTSSVPAVSTKTITIGTAGTYYYQLSCSGTGSYTKSYIAENVYVTVTK